MGQNNPLHERKQQHSRWQQRSLRRHLTETPSLRRSPSGRGEESLRQMPRSTGHSTRFAFSQEGSTRSIRLNSMMSRRHLGNPDNADKKEEVKPPEERFSRFTFSQGSMRLNPMMSRRQVDTGNPGTGAGGTDVASGDKKPEAKPSLHRTRSTGGIFDTVGLVSRKAAFDHVDETHPRRLLRDERGRVQKIFDPVREKYRPIKKQYGWWSANTGHFWPRTATGNCLCCMLCFYCCGCARTSRSDFEDYGAGITSYFKFLKWGSILFFILGILFTPQLIINGFATYHQEQGSLLNLARLTAGNLGDRARGINLPEGFCSTFIFQYPAGCQVPKSSISELYTIIAVIGTLAAFAAWLWLRELLTAEEELVEGATYTAKDYTMLVESLPKRETDLEGRVIRQHFKNLLSDHFPDEDPDDLVVDVNVVESEYPMLKLFKDKKKVQRKILRTLKTLTELLERRGDVWEKGTLAKYIQYQLRTGDNDEDHYRVGSNEPFLSRYCNCCVPSNTDKIRRLQDKIGKLTREEKRIQDDIIKTVDHMDSSEFQSNMGRQSSQNIGASLRNLGMSVRSFGSQHNTTEGIAERSSKTTAKAAFVTFNDMEAIDICQQLYPDNVLAYLRQPQELRLHEKHKIRLREAPPPDLIKWHNYRYDKGNRFFRRSVTLFISGIILFISFVLSYVAAIWQDEFSGSRAQICNDVFSDFEDVIDQPNETLPLHDPRGVFDNSTMERCHCELIDFEQKLKDFGLDAVKESEKANLCEEQFCLTVLFESSVFNAPDRMNSAGCASWMRNYIFENGITVVAALFVVLFNIILKQVMTALSVFEKHHSITSRLRSVTWRLLVLMYINTALVRLFVYSDFIDIPYVGVQANINYEDFTPDWYVFVGTSLLVTMISYIPIGQLKPCFKTLKTKWNRRKEVAASQEDLNEKYMGPIFPWKERYSFLMNMFFVILTYGGGLPLLFWVGFISFVTTYWVDKYMFCNIYRTPARHDTGLLQTMISTIPVALVIHTGFSAWMYTAPSVFRLGDDDGEPDEDFALGTQTGINRMANRLTTPTAIPLIVTMGIVVLFLVVMQTFHILCSICRGMVNLLTCGRYLGEVDDDSHITSHECHSRARKPRFKELIPEAQSHHMGKEDHSKNILVGLKDYNILRNPKYKELTGVSDKFADGYFDSGYPMGWRPKKIIDAAKYGSVATQGVHQQRLSRQQNG